MWLFHHIECLVWETGVIVASLVCGGIFQPSTQGVQYYHLPIWGWVDTLEMQALQSCAIFLATPQLENRFAVHFHLG